MISSCGFFPDLVTLIPSEDAVDGGSALPCLYIVLLLGYFITVFFFLIIVEHTYQEIYSIKF